jgi:hypothetical protein
MAGMKEERFMVGKVCLMVRERGTGAYEFSWQELGGRRLEFVRERNGINRRDGGNWEKVWVGVKDFPAKHQGKIRWPLRNRNFA